MKKLSCSWQNHWKNLFTVFTLTIFTIAQLCEDALWKEHLCHWGCNIKQKANANDDRWWGNETKRQQVFFSNKVMACKWMDNQSVLFLPTALECLNDFSTVQQREKAPNPNLSSLIQSLSYYTTTGWEVFTSGSKELHRSGWIVSLLFVFTFGSSLIWWNCVCQHLYFL